MPKNQPLSFFLFFFFSVGGFNPEQKRSLEAGLTAKMYDAVIYLCMAIMVALKFKCHLREVSLDGTHVILQHIQNSSDWADDYFFEPNNQGLCSAKNG